MTTIMLSSTGPGVGLILIGSTWLLFSCIGVSAGVMTGYVCARFMPNVSRDKGVIIGLACGAAVGFVAPLVSWFWFPNLLVIAWFFLFSSDLSGLPEMLCAGLTSTVLTWMACSIVERAIKAYGRRQSAVAARRQTG